MKDSTSKSNIKTHGIINGNTIFVQKVRCSDLDRFSLNLNKISNLILHLEFFFLEVNLNNK
jgi:hypothetical protein